MRKELTFSGRLSPKWRSRGSSSRLEEAAHERFVHHGHVLRRLVVGGGEVAPSDEFDAELLQVVRAHAIPRRAGLFARCRQRLAGNQDAFAPIVGQRIVEGQPRAPDTRNAREPFLDVAVECRQPLARDRGRWPADRHQHSPVAGETEVLAFEVAQAATEHRRARHQHHRERRLQDEQRLASEGSRVAGGSARSA